MRARARPAFVIETADLLEAYMLAKWLHDCEEWERSIVLPLVQARIEIELDDGVKVDYQHFPELLAPIPGLAAADDRCANIGQGNCRVHSRT